MSDDEQAAARVVSTHRGQLFGLAYRMLGSVTEAEDAVQEAFMRWSRQDHASIRSHEAWLTTTTTNLCLDRLGSARARRESYVGEWLPEPLAQGDDPAEVAGTADSVTFAFLVVLETLTPLERAAFLLHDVFGHPHAEVATMLDRSPAAVRQLVSRARRHVHDRTPRRAADPLRATQVTDAFLRACEGEDLDAMVALLAPDVHFVSDGGGRATAAGRPVDGADRVARMLLGFVRTGPGLTGLTASTTTVNNGPAWVLRRDGVLETLFGFDVRNDRITAIWAHRNPDKLAVLER